MDLRSMPVLRNLQCHTLLHGCVLAHGATQVQYKQFGSLPPFPSKKSVQVAEGRIGIVKYCSRLPAALGRSFRMSMS